VRAVTTVIDDVDLRTRLAWKELGIFGRRDVKLATGASEPLLDAVHNGRAREFDVLTAGDTVPPEARRRAADVMIEMLLGSPDRMTILAVGPLTNVALALKTEPRIKAKIERIVLMGGAYQSGQPEYNIQRDRIAADIVFRSGVPITAVGLDVTLKCKLRAGDLDRLRLADDPASLFLRRLLELAKSETNEELPTLHDPLAVAVAFRPDLVEMAKGSVSVETADPAAYGVTKFTAGAGGTTEVGREVKVGAFLDLLMDRVARGR
jgi:inosine-uridine nucleoside N-ribohydrolase